MRPSFLGLIASGLLIFLSIIVVLMNYKYIHAEHAVMIVLLFAIAISAHSIQHSLEEIFFHFNPLVGNWRPQDIPIKSVCPCGPQCNCKRT
jgi:hypothetical protein